MCTQNRHLNFNSTHCAAAAVPSASAVGEGVGAAASLYDSWKTDKVEATLVVLDGGLNVPFIIYVVKKKLYSFSIKQSGRF